MALDSCPLNNSTPVVAVDDRGTNNSYCELCGTGQVTVRLRNPTDQSLENIAVNVDLSNPRLEYAGNAAVFHNGGFVGFIDPDPGSPADNPRWTAAQISQFNSLSRSFGSCSTNNVFDNDCSRVEIRFDVRSQAGQEENLVAIPLSRQISAQATYQSCPDDFGGPTSGGDSGNGDLSIREPIPSLSKTGQNRDAGQSSWTNTVFGNINDDIVWQISINNNGLADMQDVRLDDLMTDPNVTISHACPDAGSAQTIADNNGVGGAPCISATNTIDDFVLSGAFASGPGVVDVPAGGQTNIYLVGKVNTSCSNNGTNTVSDFQWGCEITGNGPGGISRTSGGSGPFTAQAQMSARSQGELTIARAVTGLNTSQPLGTRGYVTIRVTNNTGGSVKNVQLRDVLPSGYVVDPTFDPTILNRNRPGGHSGDYDGFADQLEWDPLDSDPLQNTEITLRLVSDEAHPIYGDQVNMLRHADSIRFRFRIVTINQDYYDLAANLDVPEENSGDGTDPDSITTLQNQIFVQFEDFCNPGSLRTQDHTDNVPVNPEDLDVSMDFPLYIVRDSGTSPLTVSVTNNGGHETEGEDYFIYATFGQAMNVVNPAAGCSATSNPPPHPVWNQPDFIPASARVYLCQRGTISPGETETFTFDVERNAGAADDDLTFRADVVGEIRLASGDPLTFPSLASIPETTPNQQEANNYTLDGVRARVLGFNLLKNQDGLCNELNEAGFPDENIIIGEECSFQIHGGGWFGFDTPGFTLIAVEDITVRDDLPDGQGYIAHSYLPDNDIAQGSITESGGLNTLLDETDLDWIFGQGSDRIQVKDQWLRTGMTTRLLNDQPDTVSDPNRQGNSSIDVGRAYFLAIFDSDGERVDIQVNDGVATVDGQQSDIPGYPPESDRTVELTVTEPELEILKEVCNENLYDCDPNAAQGTDGWTDLTDEGHKDQTYLFRIIVSNRAAGNGADRAPAYDVVVTDTLDASGQMCVRPFDSDGIDNDGDGVSETGEDDGLVGTGAGLTDYVEATHCRENGTPAVITFSYEHSDALKRIDPGQSVTLQYRVEPHQSVAPQQLFTNTAEVLAYDSLEDQVSNQSNPPVGNENDPRIAFADDPRIGGARIYTGPSDQAQMRIIEVQAQPKAALELSNGTASGTSRDTVVVGEEIRYQLTTQIPAAKLRDFRIRDELPAGMRCIEGQVVDLDASPYDAGGFVPGGSFAPTCTSTGTNDYIEWDFGDQELTTVAGSLFDFPVEFIARIENSTNTDNGDVLTNGGGASGTIAEVRYIDEGGNLVVVPFDAHEVEVLEPNIQLTKSFAVPNSDADDILTVTVTAENTGTANAYNLQVLDDLTGTKLVYQGNIGGTDPPQNDDITTIGPNAPIFSWNRGNDDYTIAPGETRSFTFEVQVEQDVEPHEILDNTIQARWQSLPGQDVALNSSNSIGTDGADDGMRIGVLPNAGDAINNYETDAAAQTEVPPLQFSKADLDPLVVPTIGAHKQFQLEIRLPEGISQNVVVTDQLGSPEGYVLTHNADYDITYEFVGIEQINGQAPSEAAFNSFPGDNTSPDATWNIGTVDTESENDTAGSAIDPVIRITYFARVNNDTNTDDGDSRQNGAALSYDNGEDGTTENLNDTTDPVTVVEPQLTVDKTVSNATNPGNLPVGGDVLEYVITVQHDGASTADAFDLNLVDTLPPELQFDNSFTPTAEVNSNPVAGFVTTPAGAPAGPLIWGRENSDNSLDLPLGGTLVLTYRAQVTGVFGQPINNSVVLDWTSLDDSSINDTAYERFGETCPTGSAPNDYCAGPAEAPIDTEDNTSIVKTVIADTDTDTAVGEMRVGDTVTYRLELNLQSGTTPAVTVSDQLPAGLTFESVVSVNGDTSAPYSESLNGYTYSANSVPPDDATGIVLWDLGDITSEFGNTNAFVIEYIARVTEDSGIAAPSATLTNTAELNYSGASATLQDDASITVLQPVIDGLTKTDATRPTSHMNVDPANDIMLFTLQACNSGLAPAYDLSLTDNLATQMDETSIANIQVSIDGNPLVDGGDYTYTAPAARGGDMLFEFSAPVPAGVCLDISYEIGFHTDIGGGENWVNTFTVDDYWSLPAESGQQYATVPLPTPYPMGTGATSVTPPAKTLQSDSTAAVGEEVIYRIQVPGSATTSAIYDVAITDTLDPSLELVQVQEINGLPFTDNTIDNDIALAVDLIPAGTVAIFEVTARAANNTTAQAGYSFDNLASYTYAEFDGSTAENGGSDTAETLTIVEPELALAKTVTNQTNPGNDPDAGDVLRFTLDLTAAGNPENSDAFDLIINEQLSLGLELVPGSVTFGGAAIADPALAGDGVNTAQTLDWNRTNSNLDIAAGGNSQLVFDAVVLDSVLAATDLSGTSRIEWTSLNEDNTSPYERNGSDGVGGLNDYVIENSIAQLTAANDSTIAKTRLDDSFGTGDAQLRVGDFVEYELRLSLPEGSAPNAAITDTLPQGLVFDDTLAINGDNSAPFVAAAPFSHGDIIEPVPAGDPAAGPTTVTWNIADLINSGDNDAANDEFVIRYRARVLNQDVHPWPANNTPLTNNVDFNFDAATGAENRNDGETLDLLQPNLDVAITSNPADGATLAPGDPVDYTVTITNNGSAPAYDTVFRDTIPLGLRQGGVSVQSTSVNGAAVADLAPAYDASTGEAVWNFGAGTAYAIDPGQTLVMTYRVQADPNLGAGLNMQNAAFVEIYYSLDDDNLPTLAGATAIVDMREDYGPTAPQSVQFNTPNAAPLLIENTQPTASIGEPFRYRVTIPETPQNTALHDVRILLNLGTSAADLVFVEAAKVSGSQVFAPVNSGSDTDLVIEDTTNGIDVPPGEQVVVDITVRLRDVNPPNVDGLTFNNSASYNYNYENDNAAAGQGAGAGNTTADMTVVEPTALTMTKTGPASVQSGLPGRFTLDVHNTGTGPAWDISITDILPNNDPGGMCETPPANFAAEIVDGGGNSVATLNAGEHFNTVFDPANCTLTITTSGAAAMVPADHRLLFSYDAYLDADTADGDSLINVAGVELWHSWDSTGPDARQYTRPAPTDGTPGTLDHEDAYTITAAVPSVSFYKVVENVTSGDSPASTASPGDTMRYTLTLTNLSTVDVDNVGVIDELDRLNGQPLFQSGSLQIISAPAGADTSGTDAAGGVNGSGLLSVADLSLAAGDSIEIVYQVSLAAVIDNGTAVLNQAQVQLPGQQLVDSDDPNINGADDPDVAGDEDPTQVVVESAPELVVEKTSEDVTGDPELLMVGDTLRYTLSVENTGNENIVAATLRDQVPANTTYVPNSTTLNGAAVADVDSSTPLSAGMPINSPGEDEGFVGAVEGTQPVLITFDVTINDVRDGTIISNQGFVNGEGAGSGPFPEKPSDDPGTDTPDDPTIDIVGDVPLLRAQKTVEIAEEVVGGTDGIVDPGDVLRYTITVTNMGGVDAADVVLTDQVPADTTYVAGTTILNGIVVDDNAGGMTRLDSGLPISSSDLTPPLPGAGEGVITSAQTATITFDVTVNEDTPTGTVISNQGGVAAAELPLTLTDADGNPANGAQPTQVVVGDAQQLSIIKEVAVVGGGAALPGATLEYRVTVTNISAVPAGYVVITDDLLSAGEGVLTYVADSALLNGQDAGVSVNGTVITADYSTSYGDLLPGEEATLRFQATLAENLEIGFQVLNTAEVTWNDPPASEQASVVIDVGGTPGIANLSGFLWHDVNFNDELDAEERLLSGWTVELYFDNALLDSLQADEDGYFQFAGLVPNLTGGASYELRYQAPNATETTASLGDTSSDFTNGPQRITEIFVGPGSNPQNLNLPITPNGVVYDSVLRQPVSGAMLTLLRASSGQELPDRCFDDEKQQSQVALDGGYYKFDINFSDAACPANADYLIQVQVPEDGYEDGQSLIIPPQTHEETAGFDVGACLGSNDDLVPGTADHCEVQESFSAPGVDVDARDPRTDYYLRLTLDDNRIPGESQLFNNHIPVDPLLEGALSITKTAGMLNVTRSQLVPYTITFSNTLPVPLADLQLVDFFPAGFKYVAGSARLDGLAEEPEVEGLQLHWNDLRVDPDQTRTVKLLLVVGSGVGEGKYVNRARMFNQLSGQQASGEASATVRVVPDPTFDCTDVIGKVYDDKNMNGYQDQGEGGVPGARVVTATGLNATTDAHGRFHITCAVVPNRDRGSNFIMKLDDRSLPSGYRLTSENPRVVRATRGKAIKVNFGASLHRVVRLDMAEGVFEPETTELRPQWHSRTELLLEKLQEAPSVLRLSYLAENEDPDLVERRLQTIKAQIAEDWAEQYGNYELTIETEVFWRRGAPPKRGGLE
ncbi:isopeptide-forming domain-containing fimbrial protein [Microbulbifer sp.]|uniref:isopeptide-forming domain-containing fimbrial protein n=1 Tax=Microbulbifer sp. TaxID=1908541 RepID=UPI003F2FDEDA